MDKTKTIVTSSVGTKMGIAVAFLGVASLAAAGMGMRFNDVQKKASAQDLAVRQKIAAETTQTADKISYGYYVDYMKKSKKNTYSENDFWQQVAASNWFLSDSLVILKSNQARKNEYVTAMTDAIKGGKYTNLKKWYNFVYAKSGFNFDNSKLQKNVWLIMREASYKKYHFGDKSIAALTDTGTSGGGIKMLRFKFSKNEISKKPLSPAMFAVIQGLSELERTGGKSAGASSGGSFNPGSVGGGSSSGSSSVDCNENASGGSLGGNAGGSGNPAGMVKDPVNPNTGMGNSGSGGSVDTTAGSKNQSDCVPYNVMPSSIGGGSVGFEGEGDSDLNNIDYGMIDRVNGILAEGRFGGVKELVEDVQAVRNTVAGVLIEMSAQGVVKSGGLYLGYKGKFGGSKEYNPEGNMNENGLSGGCGGGISVGGGSGDCGSGGGCGAAYGKPGSGLIKSGMGGDLGAGSGIGGGCDFAYSIMNTLDFFSDPSPIEYDVNVSLVGGVEQVIGLTKITK